jgi:hypothetical protein
VAANGLQFATRVPPAVNGRDESGRCCLRSNQEYVGRPRPLAIVRQVVAKEKEAIDGPYRKTWVVDGRRSSQFTSLMKSRIGERDEGEQKDKKTYNRRDSQMVTHSSTSRPVQCLCMAERTGCPVLTDLWSYVMDLGVCEIYRLRGAVEEIEELI